MKFLDDKNDRFKHLIFILFSVIYGLPSDQIAVIVLWVQRFLVSEV